MIVDTSVWIGHFRMADALLADRLGADMVWTHPFIIGELACGNISARRELLSMLGELRSAPLIEHDEVLQFIDNHKLHGLGLGWVDMHLLASAHATRMPLWTFDRRMEAVALKLNLTPRTN